MIIIISFLTNWCIGITGTNFCDGLLSNSGEGTITSSSSTFLPLTSFERNSFSRKDPFLSNEYLAFGSMIEGVPNSLLWVSYANTFLRFGFELIRLKLFHISIAAPNFKKRQLGFLLNHSSYSVVSTDLDGALFNMNAAVSKA